MPLAYGSSCTNIERPGCNASLLGLGILQARPHVRVVGGLATWRPSIQRSKLGNLLTEWCPVSCFTELRGDWQGRISHCNAVLRAADDHPQPSKNTAHSYKITPKWLTRQSSMGNAKNQVCDASEAIHPSGGTASQTSLSPTRCTRRQPSGQPLRFASIHLLPTSRWSASSTKPGTRKAVLPDWSMADPDGPAHRFFSLCATASFAAVWEFVPSRLIPLAVPL